MQRWWRSRARIFACKQPQQFRFACEISVEFLVWSGEESQWLLMFYSCVRYEAVSAGSRVDLQILSSFYDLKFLSTCAVGAVRRVWLKTVGNEQKSKNFTHLLIRRLPLMADDELFIISRSRRQIAVLIKQTFNSSARESETSRCHCRRFVN